MLCSLRWVGLLVLHCSNALSEYVVAAPTPELQSVVPSIGPAVGGITITITGRNLYVDEDELLVKIDDDEWLTSDQDFATDLWLNTTDVPWARRLEVTLPPGVGANLNLIVDRLDSQSAPILFSYYRKSVIVDEQKQ